MSVNAGSYLSITGNGTFALTGNTSTTLAPGVVQLNDTTTSVSTTQAATANAVNTAMATAQGSFAKSNLTYQFGNAIIAANLTVSGGTQLIINSNTILVVSANLPTYLALSSNGTTQATASYLNNAINLINTGNANSGVILNGPVNTIQYVVNYTGNTINVFPVSGGSIATYATNLPILMANNYSIGFYIAPGPMCIMLTGSAI